MLSKEEVIKKVAYRFYEIRTDDSYDNPLIGYGDSERDYQYAKRIVEKYISKTLDEGSLDLFGEILKKENIDE